MVDLCCSHVLEVHRGKDAPHPGDGGAGNRKQHCHRSEAAATELISFFFPENDLVMSLSLLVIYLIFMLYMLVL